MQDGTNIPARRRGRPRAFDPDAALERALHVFWEKGFAAASLDDLATAMGLNRPSLYAAFGDKRALYARATARFMEDMRAMIGEALGQRPLAHALKSAFAVILDRYTGGEEPRGCLVICTAATEAPADPEIRRLLGLALETIDAAFRNRLGEGQKEGELPQDADPAVLGALLGALMHSLGVRARAGHPAPELRRMADAAIDQLLGLAGAAR